MIHSCNTHQPEDNLDCNTGLKRSLYTLEGKRHFDSIPTALGCFCKIISFRCSFNFVQAGLGMPSHQAADFASPYHHMFNRYPDSFHVTIFP